MCFFLPIHSANKDGAMYSTVDTAPEVVVGPGPLCVLREIPDQSDLTVD